MGLEIHDLEQKNISRCVGQWFSEDADPKVRNLTKGAKNREKNEVEVLDTVF